MNFEETLYLRDDEADEFGDSGAFNDSLDSTIDSSTERANRAARAPSSFASSSA